MSSALLVSKGMKTLRRCGNIGVYTSADFAYMLGRPRDKALQNIVSRLSRQGVIARIARDLYYDPVDPPSCTYLLERIAVRIHRWHCIYTSLEYELSRAGIISQVMMQWITVMTTGRSGVFTTPFGTIEFTHTERDVNQIADQLYWDTEAGIFRARPERALADLRRVGRNLHMIDDQAEYDAA